MMGRQSVDSMENDWVDWKAEWWVHQRADSRADSTANDWAVVKAVLTVLQMAV
jgi:hypothetical protein